jgi:neuraminyllactose-binding hemagglutinin
MKKRYALLIPAVDFFYGRFNNLVGGCMTNKSTIRGVVVIGAVLLLAACAPTPIKKEIGAVNFEYKPTENLAPVNKSIAVVSPDFGADITAQNNQPRTPMEAMLMANQQRKLDFNQRFYNGYRPQLAAAFQNSFNELISSKGFKTMGPYASADEITYTDKKTQYLAAIPKLRFLIDQKGANSGCDATVCQDQGEIQITGELAISLVEPLTGQALINKRINLSDFQIRKQYLRQWKNPTSNSSLVNMAISAAAGPKELVDNTDKVMTEALNEFYAQSMAKIDKLISQEELLSFEKDIGELKNAKRF